MIEPAAQVGLYRTGFEKIYRLALPPRPLKYFFSAKNHAKCEGWAGWSSLFAVHYSLDAVPCNPSPRLASGIWHRPAT